MRALWRRFPASLAMAAAVLAAAAGAVHPAHASAHPSVALSADCPNGTNWDTALQRCV